MGTYGWEPIILTVKNGNFESTDDSLAKDANSIAKIFTANSIEPHSIFEKLKSLLPNIPIQKSSGNNSKTSDTNFFEHLAEYIRLNLFIPDSRIGWFYPAYKMGIKIIKEEKPDIIYSTAPPFTAHLIAKRLKQFSKIPWVADYRDPWLECATYNTVGRLSLVKKINRILEKSVLANADKIVVTGENFRELYLQKLEMKDHPKCHIITNGYDTSDTLDSVGPSSKRFYITYSGTLRNVRYYDKFYEAISLLINNDNAIARDLCVRIIGNIDSSTKQQILSILPKANVEFRKHVPYKEALNNLYFPQVLALFIDKVDYNETISTGKIFDYLPTGNPIICIGPIKGDSANIILETYAGKVFSGDDANNISKYILDSYTLWKNNQLNTGTKHFPQFQRKHLTKYLTKLFDNLVTN
jgi:glycosyltransferase involved in cell wall biosynthesis